jgi:hypothetical protein
MYNNIIIFVILIVILVIGIYMNNKPKNIENYDNLTPFPIDVVYTWAGEKKSLNIRLSNNNELKYSLRSVFQFMPWVNHIFIIMNPPKKKPSWLNNDYSDKITILDHYDTFENKQYVPTTNSNSIETTINNIPELSEHFIYFNDDFYIGKPVSYKDFFTENGKMIIYYKQLDNCKPMQIPHKEKIINFNLPIYCGISYHIPLPNKKSVITKFNNQYKNYIDWVRNIKKRYGRGFDMCIKNNLENWCQQQHTAVAKYAYDNKDAILKVLPNNSILYFATNYNIDKLQQIKYNPPMFFCINDGYSFKNIHDKEEIYTKINLFLENYYEISFCEK